MIQVKPGWVDFKAIKARVSIVQILEHYGALQTLVKSGSSDRLSGGCPIHGGSNKTHFRASISKNCWNCFGKCQGGGNVIDFVAKKEGVPFRDAAVLIQGWFLAESSEAPEKLSLETARVAESQSSRSIDSKSVDPIEESEQGLEEVTENTPLSFELSKLDPAHPYLRERGLTEESIATFGLGYCSKGLLRGHVAIPIHNENGELIAYVGRLVDASEKKPKYKLPKGFRKSLEVFNYHRTIRSEQEAPIIVVEGFFDAMRLHQAGYEKVVALMGSSLSEWQEQLLYRLCEADQRIILFFDADEAGQRGQVEAQRRLSARLYVNAVQLTDGKTQPGDLSPDEVRQFLPSPERSWA